MSKHIHIYIGTHTFIHMRLANVSGSGERAEQNGGAQQRAQPSTHTYIVKCQITIRRRANNALDISLFDHRKCREIALGQTIYI